MSPPRELLVATPGRGLIDVTARVAAVLAESGAAHGLVHLFLRHTSASLLISENADPDVLHDLEAWLARLAPDGDPRYRHRDEGPDDMPSHLRAAVTATSLSIPFASGRMLLGTWQAIYVWEHRTAPHQRRLVVTVA
jgi:secondary thiamine-phosphate synthase enzyme